MDRKYIAPVVILCSLVTAMSAAAQSVELQTRQQLATVLTATSDTPSGKGLLPTALAEARTAALQATAASAATKDLGTMQQAARGVLHAIDPALVKGGPGLGYGVGPAVRALVQQLTMLRGADVKADVARTAPPALTAAQNVLRWCDATIATAQQILAAPSTEVAAPMTQTLVTLTRQLTAGTEIRGVRRPAPAATDGGLLVVQFHLRVLQVGRDAVAAQTANAPIPALRDQPAPPIPIATGVTR